MHHLLIIKYPIKLTDIFSVRNSKIPTTTQTLDGHRGRGGVVPMSDVYTALLPVIKSLFFIQIGHLGLHSLYNHFCVLSFHSILYFTNDCHMVKEEKPE